MNKFIKAQDPVYKQVLSELKAGQKQSHWMWYIFPQIAGLGRSSTAQHYAIKNMEEAKEYLNHPVLGIRLIECSKIILDLENTSALTILGSTDAMKLKSSMTLFAQAAESRSIFEKVLIKYFNDEWDNKTLELLGRLNIHAPLLSPLELEELRKDLKNSSRELRGKFLHLK